MFKNLLPSKILSLNSKLISTLLIFMVLIVRVDIYNIMINLNWISADNLLGYKWLEVTTSGISSVIHYAWMWPVTCLITLVAGFLFPVKK